MAHPVAQAPLYRQIYERVRASIAEGRLQPGDRLPSARAYAQELGVARELVREVALKVDRNEYKRQQAAPGLKVTSKAFGIGRRFPIAQRFVEIE